MRKLVSKRDFAACLLSRIDDRIEASTLLGLPWRDFAREVLNVKLWDKQEQIMDSLAQGKKRIHVGTGHGIGKTFLSAFAACWALATWTPRPIIITTAPSHRQVRDQVWGEIRSLWSRSQRLMSLAEPFTMRITIDDRCYAAGFSTNQPQKFQGIHAARMLVVIDEANGFPNDIWESIDSCLTSDKSQLLAIGNTLVPYGRFYAGFGDGDVCSYKISSREHPNVIQNCEIIPGAVTRSWIEDFERNFRSAPHVIKSRVDGEFPQGTDQGLINPAWLEAAKKNESKTTWPRVFGVDVARYGDNLSVIADVQGQDVLAIHEYSRLSLTQTARTIIDLYNQFRPEYVVVDDAGVGGGITDMLRDAEIPVIPFNGGNTATEPKKFYNAASEAWWATRLMYESGLVAHRVNCPELEMQLVTREWWMQSDKKIRIESKDDYKRRTGLGSPDHADAVTMAHWMVSKVWAENQ